MKERYYRGSLNDSVAVLEMILYHDPVLTGGWLADARLLHNNELPRLYITVGVAGDTEQECADRFHAWALNYGFEPLCGRDIPDVFKERLGE